VCLGAKRAARSRRGARPLTAEQVVGCGLELVDEVGLSGFTTRVLAERLGTYPATLYWHVGNRSQLLAAIVDRALGEVAVEPAGSVDWQEWLRRGARSYRAVLHRHPNLAPVVVSQLVVSAPATRLVEVVLSVLDRAGFRGQALAHAFNTYIGSLVGWVSAELSAPPPEAGTSWQQAFASAVAGLPPGEFPVIAANRAQLADAVFSLRWHGGAERPLDASFEWAVEAWVSGLARQLEGLDRDGAGTDS
jgi:TetR/AcrR family transcriptional regulator, tetracycline repressor protein